MGSCDSVEVPMIGFMKIVMKIQISLYSSEFLDYLSECKLFMYRMFCLYCLLVTVALSHTKRASAGNLCHFETLKLN